MSRIAVLSTETTIAQTMRDVTPQRVGSTMKAIEKAIEARRAFETQDNRPLSKDFSNVEALHNESVARFFVAISVNPEYYINSPSYDSATFESKSRIPSEAKTRNLKAYKKFAETADFLAGGSKLENVLCVFVACSIISAQHQTVIPRDVCERFLNSVPLNHVSEELAEALDHYRAKHMSGGAATQTSQCTLQLATMRAASVVRDGREKHFKLDVTSPVVESFAQRFGLVEQLERARKFRAQVEEESLATET